MAKGRRYTSSHFYWLTLILIPKRQKACILYMDYTSINKKKILSPQAGHKALIAGGQEKPCPFLPSSLTNPSLYHQHQPQAKPQALMEE